jgi:hypothetical protein
LDFSISAWRTEKSFFIQDAYKWLFQAAMGGEHAISSREAVGRWMDEEWAGLDASLPDEPLFVDLRPDRSLIRINLRPFKDAGGDKESLLDTFVRSAQEFSPDLNEFTSQWMALGSRLEHEPILELTRQQWQDLDLKLEPTYPAINHSARNLAESRPAYRVVLRSRWEEIK